MQLLSANTAYAAEAVAGVVAERVDSRHSVHPCASSTVSQVPYQSPPFEN